MTTNSRARLLAAVALALLAGCSAQHATYTPDGRRGYVITCDGYLNSYSTCLVKAGEACKGAGYDTLRGGADDRTLLIACKAPH